MSAWSAFLMPFLPLFTGIRHLAHMLTVPPTKACLLCGTPAGMDWYIEALPVGTYWVQSPGFPKIVYSHIQCLVYDVDKGLVVLFSMTVSTGQSWVGTRRRSYWTNWPGELQVTAACRLCFLFQWSSGFCHPHKSETERGPEFTAWELCESRGGRPGLPSLISLQFL